MSERPACYRATPGTGRLASVPPAAAHPACPPGLPARSGTVGPRTGHRRARDLDGGACRNDCRGRPDAR